MSPLLSAAEVASIRAAFAVVLNNTFTLTKVSAGTANTWNEQTSSLGTPTSGYPCMYESVDRLVLTESGRASVSTPVLTVAADNPLAVGDLVTDIRDAFGTVLLAGPLAVDSINEGAELGASFLRRATLKGTDMRRPD